MNEEPDAKDHEVHALERERYELLQRLEDWFDTPMLVLAFVWLALLIIELIWGQSRWFEVIGTSIWVIFLIDFAVELVLAPHRTAYLRRNWLTAVSLLIPALRLFRAFRVFRLLSVARAGRGFRLIRVVSSLNRGMKALGASLSRRGFGYVVALTVLVTLGGAAGMYAFENESPGGLSSYGDSLWWTAMIMTTMGSHYWPQTVEGRVLCVMLALYAFGIFGYVTATLATFFVGRDSESDAARQSHATALAAVHAELRAMREELRTQTRRPE